MTRRNPNSPGTADKVATLAERFHEGQFTETVYRASVYALGFRGVAIDEIVKPQLELKHARHENAARFPAPDGT
jgi:hypothetical protein